MKVLRLKYVILIFAAFVLLSVISFLIFEFPFFFPHYQDTLLFLSMERRKTRKMLYFTLFVLLVPFCFPFISTIFILLTSTLIFFISQFIMKTMLIESSALFLLTSVIDSALLAFFSSVYYLKVSGNPHISTVVTAFLLSILLNVVLFFRFHPFITEITTRDRWDEIT